MVYQQEAIRQGGATPEAAACRRHPRGDHERGRATPRRRAALLVARGLVFESATLLTPCLPRGVARRGRGD